MHQSRTFLATATCLMVLTACSGGPQFSSLIEKIMRSGEAGDKISKARAEQPVGSEYAKALYTAELGYANFEYNEMNDYASTLFHSERAIAASKGNPLPPQQTGQRNLIASAAAELSEARSRLIAQLDVDKIERLPVEAAEAHAAFNCWIEQQEENLQPTHIQRCRERFFAAVDVLERFKPATPEIAEDKTERAVPDYRVAGNGLFNFNQDTITARFAARLTEIAAEIVASDPNEVAIVAHTDSVGDDRYNLSLSQRRADAVASFLANEGVDVTKMSATGVGESQPVDTNETALGRSLNRRAEIFLR